MKAKPQIKTYTFEQIERKFKREKDKDGLLFIGTTEISKDNPECYLIVTHKNGAYSLTKNDVLVIEENKVYTTDKINHNKK